MFGGERRRQLTDLNEDCGTKVNTFVGCRVDTGDIGESDAVCQDTVHNV